MKRFLELKKQDQLQLISPEESHEVFSDLINLDLKSIVTSFMENKSQTATFSSFLNGEVTSNSTEDLQRCLDNEGLRTLHHSLRITHLETFHPEIQKFCRKVFVESGILLSCGVYITPNEKSQCFLYHSDHQHLIIYQLLGQKRWLFPLVQDQLLREYSNRPKLNQKINDNSIEFKTQETHLHKGQALFIPYAQAHKAYNDQDLPSIHLTFAEEDVNVREVMTFLAEDIFGKTAFDSHFFEAFDEEQFKKNAPLEDAEIRATKAESFFTKSRMIKFKFGLKA